MNANRDRIIDTIADINAIVIITVIILLCIILVPVMSIAYIIFGSNTNLTFLERVKSVFIGQT